MDDQQQWATPPATSTPADQPAGPASQLENASPATPAPQSTDPAPAAPAAPAAASDPTTTAATGSTLTPASSDTSSSSPASSPASSDSSSSTPTPSAPATADPAPADQMQQFGDMVAKMQAELESLRSQVSSGQLTPSQVDSEISAKVTELRKDFETWPQEGDTRPQPWDLKSHGLPQPGVTRDYLPGGQPDELSPVVPAHGKPILIPGTAGSAVEELAGLLAQAGYATSISQGRNHTYAFDDTITAAVSQFKKDFGVQPDPSQFPADSSITSVVVDAWIWEALLRVVARA